MRSRNFTLFFLIFLGGVAFAQSRFLLNPSFEDGLHFGISPTEWITCEKESTPDVQPGHVGVQLPASDGKTYLGLVMRGTTFQKSKTESVQAELLHMFEKGKIYKFEIDLASPGAYEMSCGRKIIDYKDVAKLQFLGIKNDCTKGELLYETQAIENKNWLTYSFDVTAKDDYNYIKLQVGFDNSKASYIVCDNFRIKEISKKKKKDKTDIFITNIFSPNNDGKNDYFVINKLPDNSSLTIFDKNQIVLFESENYQNNWKGTDKNGKMLASGTYFYTLKLPNVKKPYTGFILVKKN